MSLQGFYTEQGLALAAKLSAGTKLTITKVTAGAGTTGALAAALVSEKQTLAVGAAEAEGNEATLHATLAEAEASADYTLAELGVYANDPEAGEILYQVFALEQTRGISAGGENVYHFCLKEDILGADGIEVLCSPAGLVRETAFTPVQSRVLAIDAPYRGVNLTPAELPAYLKALPRLLTEDLWIALSAGTCAENLYLGGFYGPGRLWIQAASEGEAVFTGGCYLSRCSAQIVLSKLKFVGGKGHYNDIICVEDVPGCSLRSCTIDAASIANFSALELQGTGNCLVNGGTIQNAAKAVLTQGAIVCTLLDVAASGNTVGAKTYGGVVMLSGSTPLLLGGSSHQNSGGLVVKANGTLN